MKEYGKWYPISTPPTEKGVYLVANRKGTISLQIHNPIYYYPFNLDPNGPEYFEPTCWANVPELSKEFTDINVINSLEKGKSEQNLH